MSFVLRRVRLAFSGRRLRVTFLLALLALGGLWLWARLAPLPGRLSEPGSAVIEFADGSPAHVFLSPDGKWRVPIAPADVDPAYLAALFRLEDKRFLHHPGIDPLAALRSFVLNLRRRRVVSGASTLTMQLARVLEPGPRSSLRTKLRQGLRALQLELRLSKDQILAAYLQFIPFGHNVEGVEAAALSYFGHGAASLSAAEIATLLAVPQDPGRRFPDAKNTARLTHFRDRIAERLYQQGALPLGRGEGRIATATALSLVRAAPVPDRLLPFPRHAIHAAMWLRRRKSNSPRLRTTLQRDAQLLVERLLFAARADAVAKGIHNAAVVVVNHESGEITALVGSFDFWDPAHGGQIAGFDRPRSPGSALKPVLYALAIDRGLGLPDFLVADIPMRYGTYAPRNFDREFAGLVRLEDALSRSLNLPFVNLLNRLGVERFVGTLRSMGAANLSREPGHYGLSAAVGGLEVTPLEMAGLYAALAADGRYRPPRLLRDATPVGTLQGFSPGAAYLTRQALSRKDRPDFPRRRRMTGAAPAIFWKTGTSFGHRDAWAAGAGAHHTAVVWLGNFDNAPSVDLVGAEAAGPMLFDLLEALHPGPTRHIAPVPEDLKQIEVCAYSGRLPSAACAETHRVLAPRGSVPTERCPYHQAIDLDKKTGLRLSPTCRANHDYATRTYLVWPASLQRWLKDQQEEAPSPPPYAPGCEPGGKLAPPVIVSPQAGQTVLLIPGVPEARQPVPLLAEVMGDGAAWFIDGEFLETVASGERAYYTPRPGEHEITVVDNAGQLARRTVKVLKVTSR